MTLKLLVAMTTDKDVCRRDVPSRLQTEPLADHALPTYAVCPVEVVIQQHKPQEKKQHQQQQQQQQQQQPQKRQHYHKPKHQ